VTVRCAIELAPVPTKMVPIAVAFAGAVSFRSSRTVAFQIAEVRVPFAVAVAGVVQATVRLRSSVVGRRQ
jgi:hypothetical protein